MAHDPPDRVQRGLDRALGPRGCPGDVVTGDEDAALFGVGALLAVLLVPSRRRLEELRNMEPTAEAAPAASPALADSPALTDSVARDGAQG